MNYTVVRKDWKWNLIKELKDSATTLGHTIYMPEWYYNPAIDPRNKQGLLIHEIQHVSQFEQFGYDYCSQWLFSKAKRREYEMFCYKCQLQYLKQSGILVDVEAWSKTISNNYSIFKFIEASEAKIEIEKWMK